MADTLRFVSGLSTEDQAAAAVDDLVAQIEAQRLEHGLEPHFDLALIFLTPHFTYSVREIAAALRQRLNLQVLMGCTAESVVGIDREIEDQAGIALVAAQMPNITLTPFILQSDNWPVMLLQPEEFQRVVEAPPDTKLILLLGDPFTTPMDDVLIAFNQVYSRIPVVGGLASGALRPFGNALFLNDQVADRGAIGVALSGRLDVDVVVSQGCKPIWRPFKVIHALKNQIYNLDGRAPLAWLQDLIPELSESDRDLLRNGLFIGRAIKQEPDNLGRGDFLIRGVMGIDQQSGAISVGDHIQDGETIQFHLRDALTAREDLDMMLIPQAFRHPPAGAILFTCNGRGMRLYDYPNGDISIIQRNLGGTPLAGFFCSGEIGPIGAENFLHGHTASLILFRE
jgi:small ligand-binding sensory domain FIST